MKKLLYILLTTCLFTSFVSCSSDDDNNEDTNYYSAKQKESLTLMKGTFEDTTFGLSGMDHNRIIFGTQYDKATEIKSGNSVLINAQGECIWHNRDIGDGGEDIECYYEVSIDAIYFSLVYKGGENDKTLFKRFEPKIVDQSKFTLKDSSLSLPYSFVSKK
jgi:hypothetical protein